MTLLPHLLRVILDNVLASRLKMEENIWTNNLGDLEDKRYTTICFS